MVKRKGTGARPKQRAEVEMSDTVTTAIHVPRRTLVLLRRVSVERANRTGGRPSVSAVVSDLVERNRAELEEEAKQS